MLLGFLAFCVYVPGFWWGAPHATAADRTNAWGVDDEPPLGPLAQAHDIVFPKPEQNPNLGYPLFHPFMVLAAYTPYVAWLWASDGLASATVGYPHGFVDPVRTLRDLTLIAHFLSVLLAVGVVLAAYETARTLWDEASGVAAAIAVMLIYPMFYYARNSNVDVPVLFLTACGLAATARLLVHGYTTRRLLWIALFVGLSVGTKEPSFASFVFVPLVLPFLRGADGRPLWRDRRFVIGAAGATALSLATYAAASGLIVDFDRWRAHMAFAQTRMAEARSSGVPWIKLEPWTLRGHIDLLSSMVGLLASSITWPGLVLAAVGLVHTISSSPRRAAIALSALGYMAVIFISARFGQLRYLLPVALVAALFAGRAAALAWRNGRTVIGLAGLGTAAVAVTISAAWAADLTWSMLNDTRYDAGRWIERTARPGDAIEYFGSEHKHPPMPASVSSRQVIPFLGSTIRADTSMAAVERAVAAVKDRAPRFVVIVPDYTSPAGAPHSGACPPGFYRLLESGSIGYSLVATFEDRSPLAWFRRPSLDYPVVAPPIRIYARGSV
ncbi:MAG: ArnT family glycosyltransferase [Gemmatimonadota bacterium]